MELLVGYTNVIKFIKMASNSKQRAGRKYKKHKEKISFPAE